MYNIALPCFFDSQCIGHAWNALAHRQFRVEQHTQIPRTQLAGLITLRPTVMTSDLSELRQIVIGTSARQRSKPQIDDHSRRRYCSCYKNSKEPRGDHKQRCPSTLMLARMWADAQRYGRPPNIGGAICWVLLRKWWKCLWYNYAYHTAKCGWRPLLECLALTLPI